MKEAIGLSPQLLSKAVADRMLDITHFIGPPGVRAGSMASHTHENNYSYFRKFLGGLK